MSMDEVKKRFVNEVDLRAFKDQYLDEKEEMEILQSAIKDGVDIPAARAALIQVCDAKNYILESQLLSNVKKVLETFAENDGVISEKEYNDAVGICKKEAKGKRSDIQCKRMVMQLIDENNYKPKTGWFSSWYDKVKKDIGMA